MSDAVTEHNLSLFQSQVALGCGADPLGSVSVAQGTPRCPLSPGKHPNNPTVLLRARLAWCLVNIKTQRRIFMDVKENRVCRDMNYPLRALSELLKENKGKKHIKMLI